MNKVLQKISDKLNSHDSIIMACSTFGCKDVLTLEKGYVIYWVRLYKNGRVSEQDYYRRFADAKEAFCHYKKDNSEFTYNNYDGELKYYEHK